MLLFLINVISVYCDGGLFDNTKLQIGEKYYFRLVNGDIISGVIKEFVASAEDEESIKVKTEIGTATLFESQIVEITPFEELYKHKHRVYLLPTAEPIGSDYFISDFELLFLYAGGGIGDFLSFTIGRTFVPLIAAKEQISVINVKATVLQTEFETIARKLSIALGVNLGWVNSSNRMLHLYGATTVGLSRTNLTAVLFYKAGYQDYFNAYFYDNFVAVNYPNGAFGISLGVDSKILKRNDVHIIGELWNSDVTKATNSAVMLGVRLCNTSFSADFGMAFFTQPFVAPIVSFVWTL